MLDPMLFFLWSFQNVIKGINRQFNLLNPFFTWHCSWEIFNIREEMFFFIFFSCISFFNFSSKSLCTVWVKVNFEVSGVVRRVRLNPWSVWRAFWSCDSSSERVSQREGSGDRVHAERTTQWAFQTPQTLTCSEDPRLGVHSVALITNPVKPWLVSDSCSNTSLRNILLCIYLSVSSPFCLLPVPHNPDKTQLTRPFTAPLVAE